MNWMPSDWSQIRRTCEMIVIPQSLKMKWTPLWADVMVERRLEMGFHEIGDVQMKIMAMIKSSNSFF